MSDPLANMFVRIVNASRAGRKRLLIPYSALKMEIARFLEKEGYIKETSRRGKKNRRVIDMVFRYDDNRPLLHTITLLSKQSRRQYGGWRDLKKFRTRRGLIIVSTPKGIMSHTDSIKQKIGGEMIAHIY